MRLVRIFLSVVFLVFSSSVAASARDDPTGPTLLLSVNFFVKPNRGLVLEEMRQEFLMHNAIEFRDFSNSELQIYIEFLKSDEAVTL